MKTQNRLLANRHRFKGSFLGLLIVAGVSFGLRFWGLGRFNRLVFDETHFVRFAYQYLQGEPVFDVHPPLGKYLIALGLELAQRLTLNPTAATNQDLGIALAPLNYRWITALFGALLPLLVMGIAVELGHRLPAQTRSWFALLAGLFVAIDGLFIVESRYALINIYLVFFGLLAHWFWLKAYRLKSQIGYRILAGIALGACISVKWNGAAFGLGLLFCGRQAQPMKLRGWLIYLGLLPLAVYGLLWIPHLLISHDNLWTLHSQIWRFHQQMGQEAVHAYCSSWYSWPLLLRPIAYYYRQVGQQVYDVHGLGNPPLWWLSAASVMAVAVGGLAAAGQKAADWLAETGRKARSRAFSNLESAKIQPDRSLIPRYLVANYAANWLPWLLIRRCTFLYHYMPAAAFAFLTFAWLLSRWLHWRSTEARVLSLALINVVVLAALFWLPIYLGLPLSPDALRLRWWLKSWI